MISNDKYLAYSIYNKLQYNFDHVLFFLFLVAFEKDKFTFFDLSFNN